MQHYISTPRALTECLTGAHTGIVSGIEISWRWQRTRQMGRRAALHPGLVKGSGMASPAQEITQAKASRWSELTVFKESKKASVAGMERGGGRVAGGNAREVGAAEHACHRDPKLILRVEGEQWAFSWEVSYLQQPWGAQNGEHKMGIKGGGALWEESKRSKMAT